MWLICVDVWLMEDYCYLLTGTSWPAISLVLVKIWSENLQFLFKIQKLGNHQSLGENMLHRYCDPLEPSQPLWEGRAWQLCSGSPLSKRREMLPVKIGSHLPREYFSLLFVICVCKHRNDMQEVCNHHLDGVVEDRVEVTGGRTERRFLALPSTVEPWNSREFSIEKEWPQKKTL